jgi:hypothetical protein
MMSDGNDACSTCDTTSQALKDNPIPPDPNCQNYDNPQNILQGVGLGMANLLGLGEVYPWNPVSQDTLNALSERYAKVQAAWSACLNACKDKITADRFQYVETLIQQQTANQQLINVTIQQQVKVNSLVTFFAVGLVFIVIIYLLTGKSI